MEEEDAIEDELFEVEEESNVVAELQTQIETLEKVRTPKTLVMAIIYSACVDILMFLGQNTLEEEVRLQGKRSYGASNGYLSLLRRWPRSIFCW